MENILSEKKVARMSENLHKNIDYICNSYPKLSEEQQRRVCDLMVDRRIPSEHYSDYENGQILASFMFLSRFRAFTEKLLKIHHEKCMCETCDKNSYVDEDFVKESENWIKGN